MTTLQHMVDEEFADLLGRYRLQVVAPAEWSVFLVSSDVLIELWAYFGEGMGSSYINLDRCGGWVYPLGMVLAERLRLHRTKGTPAETPGPVTGTGWNGKVRFAIRNLAHMARQVGQDVLEGRGSWMQDVRKMGIWPTRASNALLTDITEVHRVAGVPILRFAHQPGGGHDLKQGYATRMKQAG